LTTGEKVCLNVKLSKLNEPPRNRTDFLTQKQIRCGVTTVAVQKMCYEILLD